MFFLDYLTSIYFLPLISHRYGLMGDFDNSRVRMFTRQSNTPGESNINLTSKDSFTDKDLM